MDTTSIRNRNPPDVILSAPTTVNKNTSPREVAEGNESEKMVTELSNDKGVPDAWPEFIEPAHNDVNEPTYEDLVQPVEEMVQSVEESAQEIEKLRQLRHRFS